MESLSLKQQLRLPLFGSPMFLVSSKELVAEQCKAGIVGAFPSLNARPEEDLVKWLAFIDDEIAAWNVLHPDRPAAPYAVNLIVHPSNPRLQHDLEVIARHAVPIIITSLNEPGKVVEKVHAYGGMVFHDVSTVRHAKKALAAGVDGLVLVCAGAGGHTGTLNPLAFIAEVRAFFDGPIVLSGCVTNGRQILAAEAMGADYAYMGTRFIASAEANAPGEYKQMILASSAADIVRSSAVTGLPANYLAKSFEAVGVDPATLPERSTSSFSFGSRDDGSQVKAWRDIWSAGQGVGSIHDIGPVRVLVDRLFLEYQQAVGDMQQRIAQRELTAPVRSTQ
ncbi:MAG: nitronate monooxygenase family protein [Pseudomonadota bacterium]